MQLAYCQIFFFSLFLVNEPNRHPEDEVESWGDLSLLLSCPHLVLVDDGLGTQIEHEHMHSGPTEAATDCWSLCSSKQVVQCQSQTLYDVDLHQNPSQKAPEPTYPVVAFILLPRTTLKLHKQHTQREMLAGTRSCWSKFCFMWSVPTELLIHNVWGQLSFLAHLWARG